MKLERIVQSPSGQRKPEDQVLASPLSDSSPGDVPSGSTDAPMAENAPSIFDAYSTQSLLFSGSDQSAGFDDPMLGYTRFLNTPGVPLDMNHLLLNQSLDHVPSLLNDGSLHHHLAETVDSSSLVPDQSQGDGKLLSVLQNVP